MKKKVMVFLVAVVLIFSSLYLIIFSSCGPNNLGLEPIVGGVGGFNSQLPLFSVGTYKMNTSSSSAISEVSFAYFNNTTKPFAFVNLDPSDNSLIPINIGGSQFPTRKRKVLVLGTAFAAGDNNSGRDIFWVGKILDSGRQDRWIDIVNVRQSDYIVIKGTNFIARYNYNLNNFNSTFDSITVKKRDNTNYDRDDFRNIDQDFKSISFIRGNYNNGFYGVLVGRNCVFDCISDPPGNGDVFRDVYDNAYSDELNDKDKVWEDVLPLDKNVKAFLLIGHTIDEGPNSAKFKYYVDPPLGSGWSDDIDGIIPYAEPFYSLDYLTFLDDNSRFKALYVAGRNALLGYLNTSNQLELERVEAIKLGNFSNVNFYGVTLLRKYGERDDDPISGIAVGYNFSSSSPIILKFRRRGDRLPSDSGITNSNYDVAEVDIQGVRSVLEGVGVNWSEVVFLDVNNVLIGRNTYVYVVGVDLTNCPIKPSLNNKPWFTKSLIFPTSTTNRDDVIDTLKKMRGILLFSRDAGESFSLISKDIIR
jgi:hypothetical protein